jgi:hypothetical protein
VKRETLLHEAESLYASIPSPIALTKSSPRPALKCQDPRQDDPNRTSNPAGPDPALLKRIEALTRELGMDKDHDMTPDKAMKMMQNPKFQELQKLAMQLNAAAIPPGYDAWYARRNAYDAKTRGWLASNGWRDVKGFTGRAALVEYRSETPERVVLTNFTTTKAYFSTGSGRLCFSGGCTLRATQGDDPKERTYERPNPAVTQLYVGQEGYVLKFQAIKVNNEARPQPFIYFGTLCAHLDGLPTMLGDPGESILSLENGKLSNSNRIILGYPFEGQGKAQHGAISWPDSVRSGYFWKASWEFKPV